MIYIFGNSHAHFFTNSTPSKFGEGENKNEYFRSFSMGPIIAYNFFKHHFPIMLQWVNQLEITRNDHILIAIGEVDCRWHIPYQASIQNKDPIDIVHECINRLFVTYDILKNDGYNVIGWGGHPSTTGTHDTDPSNPVFGDCISRNKISIEWSDFLEHKCNHNNIKFISIVKDLINIDKLTKMEYYTDYCHLSSEKYLAIVIEKFKTNGLL